jgi:membrane protease subunit HflK
MRHSLGRWRRPLAIGLGALLAFALAGLTFVPADQQGVTVLLGKVRGGFGATAGRLSPGLHWWWPPPLGRVHKLRVLETKRLTIGVEAPAQVLGRSSDPRRSLFLTGDRNLITIRLAVQYAIVDPVAYLFHFGDLDGQIRAAVESALTAEVVARGVDELLTTERVAVQLEVAKRTQRLLDRHGVAVNVLGVNFEQVSPPAGVLEAFNDVASAREDRDRILREAQSYRNGLLPVARGEAARLLEESRGYRARVVQQAHGEAERFTALAREHARVPHETAVRLYLETMELVLPRIETTIVEPGSKIDLDFVRSLSPPSGPAPP